MKNPLINILTPLISILAALFIGGIFIFLTGKNPFEIYYLLFSETAGSEYGIGQVLFKATPLLFTGLAVSIALRAGLLNIGGEGQLYIGAIAIAAAGYYFGYLPAIILIPLCLISGFAGGALWGFIPGFLKAKFNAHEVITTIMLNFIALALASYIVNNILFVAATVHTPEINAGAWLPRFDSLLGIFNSSPFNLSIIIALVCLAAVYYFINKTPAGYELTTFGFNKSAAGYAHIKSSKVIITTMLLSGGIAGLAGCSFVMGYKHYFELGFSDSAGFIGIAAALIGKNKPTGIIAASIFFGMLEYGGLTINTIVPKEIVTILQGLIILSIIILTNILEKRSARYAG